MSAAIKLNEKLLSEAMELTGISEKEQIMNAALNELVRNYKRRGMLSLKNSNAWEAPEFDVREKLR